MKLTNDDWSFDASCQRSGLKVRTDDILCRMCRGAHRWSTPWRLFNAFGPLVFLLLFHPPNLVKLVMACDLWQDPRPTGYLFPVGGFWWSWQLLRNSAFLFFFFFSFHKWGWGGGVGGLHLGTSRREMWKADLGLFLLLLFLINWWLASRWAKMGFIILFPITDRWFPGFQKTRLVLQIAGKQNKTLLYRLRIWLKSHATHTFEYFLTIRCQSTPPIMLIVHSLLLLLVN